MSMNETVDQCLTLLRSERDRITAAIKGLESLMPQAAPAPLTLPPIKRRRRRGAGLKSKADGNGISSASAGLTCLQCSPHQTFKNATGLGIHRTRKHFGDKSLHSSTLAGGNPS